MCAGWEGDNFVSSAGIIYIVLLCFITLCYCVPWTTTRPQIRGTKSHSNPAGCVEKIINWKFPPNKTNQSCRRIIYKVLKQTKTQRLIVSISSSFHKVFPSGDEWKMWSHIRDWLTVKSFVFVSLGAQVIVIRVKMSADSAGCLRVMTLMIANEVK